MFNFHSLFITRCLHVCVFGFDCFVDWLTVGFVADFQTHPVLTEGENVPIG